MGWFGDAVGWVDEKKQEYQEAKQEVIVPVQKGYNSVKQVLNDEVVMPAKNLRLRFGYYSPMSSTDNEAGYDWYRLRDGVTNVRARFDEYGNLQKIHPDDLQLSLDVENRVYKETIIKGLLGPTVPLLRNGGLHFIPEAYDPTLRELDFKENNQFELKVVIGDSTEVNGEAFIDGVNRVGDKWEEWGQRRAEEEFESNIKYARSSLKIRGIDESHLRYDDLLVQEVKSHKEAMDFAMAFSGGVKFSGPSRLAQMGAKGQSNPGRSQHAQKRADQGRPVSAGRSDAQNARRSDVLMEDGRWVVKGDNGRINVFEPNGEHVTTFKNPSKNTDMRIKNGRWTRPTEAQLEEFTKIFNNDKI